MDTRSDRASEVDGLGSVLVSCIMPTLLVLPLGPTLMLRRELAQLREPEPEPEL